MAANLITLGPRLWDAAQGIWGAACAAADRSAQWWAGAPKECKDAIVFTTNLCAGYEPVKFTPGFGPLGLGWGWGLVGFLLGILACAHFWNFVARMEQLGNRVLQVRLAAVPPLPPPGLPLQPLWHQAVRDALVHAVDPNRRIVLQRLLDDGDAALQLMAASAGVSRRIALSRVLGEVILLAHGAEWGL